MHLLPKSMLPTKKDCWRDYTRTAQTTAGRKSNSEYRKSGDPLATRNDYFFTNHYAFAGAL